MMENPNTAKEISDLMMDIFNRVESCRTVEETCSTEEYAACGELREFYAALQSPVVLGIEATGAMQWFLEFLEELEIQCQVGHPAKIRAAETRKQKHDRRDALLLLQLLTEERFPQAVDAEHRRARLTDTAARSTSVGEDAIASTKYLASNRVESWALRKARHYGLKQD
jgi:hypothetical protein